MKSERKLRERVALCADNLLPELSKTTIAIYLSCILVGILLGSYPLSVL